jgi:putative colanic acid biosynthesis UDP-glucose lipid carrier transferase
MFPKIRANIILRFVVDISILFFSFLVAHSFIEKRITIVFDRQELQLLFFSIVIWYFVSKMARLYEDFRSRSFAYEMVSISKVVLLYSTILSFTIFFFFNNYFYPRTFILLNAGILLLLIPVEKFLLKRVFRYNMRTGLNVKKVIIVGAGEVGMNFWEILKQNEQFGYRLAGFIDDVKKPELNGEYLGNIQDFKEILEQRSDVEDVVIALPNIASKKIQEVIALSEHYTKRVRIIPDFYRFGSGKFSVSNFGMFPLVTIRSLPLDDVENKFFKRFFDIIFTSLVFILVFSWLFPVLAFIIKLTSKGPVFFKQERWGLNNKKITCYKFRSMVKESNDVDAGGKYRQATKNDSRITPVGKFLRKSNIDELPQFWNVLKGEMSIVGPRPHPTPLNLESKDVVQNYMLRHMVKPGITGWAQVNGYRGETSAPGTMQKRVDLDVWYIENWSSWLDLQIIFQTVINMVIGDNQAY